MRTGYFKRKFIFGILLSLILLTVSVAFVFGFGNERISAFAAEGGDVTYPTDQSKVVDISLDLNGKNTSGSPEATSDRFNVNQGNFSRKIRIDVLANKISLSGSSYRIVGENNGILNPASDFVTVTSEDVGNSVVITARRVIDETYVSLKIQRTGDPEQTLFLKINIQSTVKHREEAGISGNRRRIIVGNRSSSQPETDPYTITISNNTTDTLYLAKTDSVGENLPNNSILEGHRLYKPDSEDTAWNQNKYGELIRDGDENSPWTIKDVSKYEIVNVGIESLGSGIQFKYPRRNENGIAPVIQYSVEITASQLSNMLNGGAFWDSTFKLIIELKQPDVSDTNVEFCFFVKFAPAEKPVTRLQFNMPTNLNAGVSEDKIFTGATHPGEGQSFKKTVVSAKHLVEYPNKNKFQIYNASFPEGDTTSSSRITISEPMVNPKFGEVGHYSYMDDDEVYYIITGIDNGIANVDFGISYKGPLDKPEDDLRPITVRVAFNVYGAYTINTIQLGGKKLSANINSYDKFSTLRREGYYLTGVSIANQEFASAVIDANNLVITPKTTGITDIIFTFLSTDGITSIDVSAVLDVDLNRGNWWRMQQDWAKALIIAGASIVGIAIILFIVWLFIRGINRSKREEQETVAPTSSYIVKLNSQIAANQAQRFSYSGVAAPTQTLQLGAGTTSAAPPPDLGALPPTTGATVTPAQPGDTVMTPPPPQTTEEAPAQSAQDEIVIPISDEDLIERIFVEKYEPRGMTRRSFFKSKDLQNRELEKEKERIREDVRNGMSIEEACKSEKQREEEAAAAGGAPVNEPDEEVKEEPQDPLFILLGFDPGSPMMTPDEEFAIIMGDAPKSHTEIDENGEEKVVYDEPTEEEEALNAARAEYQKLVRESEILKERLAKAEQEKEKLESDIGADKDKIEAVNAEIKSLKEQITDIEVKLSSARGKEKERLNREMADTESKIESNKTQIKTSEDNISENEKLLERLASVIESMKSQSEENASSIVASEQKLKDCEKQAKIAAERAEKARAAQTFERQFAFLSPIMESVAVIDKEMNTLGAQIEQDSQKKSELKSEVSALQTQLLGTTDATAISNMSEAIKQKNAEITQLEKNITAATKEKSDLAIDLTKNKKQAVDYIEKEDMAYEKVVEAEDKVLNRLALDEMREKAEKDKQEAEDALLLSQTVYDELVANMDSSLAEKAASVADELKVAENAVAEAQGELDALNAKMETATDDEKLMMSIDQMSLVERLEELNSSLENLRANGIKTNLEFKMKCEEDIKEAGESLEKAKTDYESASERISRFMSVTEATDLVTSGSGLISKERKIAEEANLKKKLEEQQNAIEQAKIAAKLAQEEAERAISDAEKASAASKEEAERLAKEAIERAEAARVEAEAKAAEEAEKAKAEIDKVKAEAAEEAEKARAEAEQKLEEAEKNRKEAESEAEKARRDAEEEAARARKAAEEEAERAKKEADEAAEKARLEAEEAEKANAAQQAEKEARIAEKVNRRKLEIAEIRRDLKTVETEEQGNELKEKFYNLQLRLDDEEKESQELKDLLERSMNDAAHAAELARYKALANKAPKRIVKKVTERVNKVPRRPNGARPGTHPAARPGARPGTRPSSARPGARPAARPGARPGTRPSSARPGTRPAARPGARPGTRPSGTRPGGTRPSGTRRPPQ